MEVPADDADHRATPAADLPVSFSNVRTAAPEDVGGDIRLAGFNVLNYFPTTGDQLTGCTYYTDRDGDPVTVRGAATPAVPRTPTTSLASR